MKPKPKSPFKRVPGAKGQYKSSISKKRAAQKVKNPKAKKALSKPHPLRPEVVEARPYFGF